MLALSELSSSPLKAKTTVDQHLSALESKLAELKSLILQNGNKPNAYKENKSPRAEPVYDVYIQYWRDVQFAL
jgi:gamma-glutamylcysteine synthetase